jgi:hypothetical protein
MPKKFNLYAGIAQNQYNLEVEKDHMFETVEEALGEAKLFAEDLYQLEPVRDVSEIMKEEKVSEDEAYTIFFNHMNESIMWFAEEIIEFDGKVIEIIRHQKG